MDKNLQELIGSFGVSGNEECVRNFIKEELEGYNCEIKEDKLGNLIVKMGQGEEKWMICAHMDQIGVIVTYIEETGFIRIGAVGDFEPSNMVHQFVKFKDGTKGKIIATKKNPGIEDLCIDLGSEGRDEVVKKVKEGDVAAFLGQSFETEDKIVSPNLDDRIGCYILLRLIKEMKKSSKELHFVFSTQNELGGRGARAAAYSINPKYAIVLDTEDAGDIPGGEGNITLGNGPVIRIKDRTLLMHHEIKEILENAGKKEELSLQYSIVGKATDGGTIHKEREGIVTGVVGIPCRYNHSVSEMIAKKDVESMVILLKSILA